MMEGLLPIWAGGTELGRSHGNQHHRSSSSSSSCSCSPRSRRSSMAAKRKKAERQREERAQRVEAERLRHEASQHSTGAAQRPGRGQGGRGPRRARQARGRARRGRRRRRPSRAPTSSRRRHEDVIREADRLDPDVDHRSEGYQPQATGHTHETTMETPGSGAPGTTGHDPAPPARRPGTTGDDRHAPAPPGSPRAPEQPDVRRALAPRRRATSVARRRGASAPSQQRQEHRVGAVPVRPQLHGARQRPGRVRAPASSGRRRRAARRPSRSSSTALTTPAVSASTGEQVT